MGGREGGRLFSQISGEASVWMVLPLIEIENTSRARVFVVVGLIFEDGCGE